MFDKIHRERDDPQAIEFFTYDAAFVAGSRKTNYGFAVFQSCDVIPSIFIVQLLDSTGAPVRFLGQ